MKIAILAKEKSNTVESELVPVARARGHECAIVTFPAIDISDFDNDPNVQRLLDYDVIYYRTGLGAVGSRFLKEFLAKHGRRAQNLGPGTHACDTQKTYQMLKAARAGVRIAKTVVDSSGSFDVMTSSLGSPFVAKPDQGSQGRGVRLVHSAEEFTDVEALSEDNDYIYQSFIDHTHDYRVHIVGGKAVATYSRVPVDGDFRTNLSRGGSMHQVDDTLKDELYLLAEKINALFGADISAVDFLPSETDGQLYFAEINDNPGWELSDKEATGVDMTALVLDYFERCIL
jgi:RimK family alpha-L-glutamate ligase